MKLTDFIAAMDNLAPRELALGFDNVGLLIGTERRDINKVLVALDCTTDVADEAVSKGCDMVLTHHPLMFHAIKHIMPDEPATAPIYRLIRNDIAMFAAHTNLDAADAGVNYELSKLLGLSNPVPAGEERIMRIGDLENPMMLDDFIRFAQTKLHTNINVTGKNRLIRRVAVMGGSGGRDFPIAHAAGADLYLTGECPHDAAVESGVLGLSIAVAGHFETETIVLKPLIEYLQNHTEGVQYILAEANIPVFREV